MEKEEREKIELECIKNCRDFFIERALAYGEISFSRYIKNYYPVSYIQLAIEVKGPAKESPQKLYEFANAIITAYKEHYSFPSQGESHMHDCLCDFIEPLLYAIDTLKQKIEEISNSEKQ